MINSFTIWLFNIAMGNDPFIDGLPIKNGWIFQHFLQDFPDPPEWRRPHSPPWRLNLTSSWSFLVYQWLVFNICLLYIYICIDVCMYVLMYVCMYACMYVCIYVYNVYSVYNVYNVYVHTYREIESDMII